MRVIFAGSFDPPTTGHMDIMRRAAALFDEVRIVVAHNLQKQSLFNPEERMDMLNRLIREAGFNNVIVDSWEGLIADYARKNHCNVLIRSIRNMGDIPYEQVMATMNSRLDAPLETILMFAQPELAYISSSAVRELVVWKRLPSGIVPDLVQKELEKRYGPLLQE
ncbi:MAG TPA: pantetheine-phosphate adenylyltransferase [Rectinemataceae bacterium]|nr:pantetheine-phosphate adenylyltransferase [Rectinemataceae bacterium]